MSIYAIIKMELKRMLRMPKFYFVIAMMMFFFNDMGRDIRMNAEQLGLASTPYLYPLYLQNWSYGMFVIFGIIVWMSDFPDNDSSRVFVLARMGRKQWVWARILYLFSFALVFQMICLFTSVIVLLPHVSMSTQWGDVLTNYVQTINGGYAAAGASASAENVVQEYSPVQAMLLSMLLTYLLSVMLGLFIYLVNGISKTKLGVILAMGVTIMNMLVDSLRELGYHLNIPCISDWINLGYFYTDTYIAGKNSIWEVIVRLVVLIVFLIILITKAYKRELIKIME
jgi:hypothetical protein